jgi:hypothetical protein
MFGGNPEPAWEGRIVVLFAIDLTVRAREITRGAIEAPGEAAPRIRMRL